MAEVNRHTRLQRLTDSGFEMKSDDPDIRGWVVKDGEARLVGKVDELIFDMHDQKVRYIVVDLQTNDFNIPGRQVLVPIGIAEIHESDDDVLLPGITHSQLVALPEYDKERFDTEHESNVFNVFGGLGAAALSGGSSHDREFYQHEQFNDNNLYRKRRSRD
ncbi:MAG: hypothetical protein EOO05_08770 [Chitinophagaceae bacterium]|nr:MAG: hypothetical protein EOO05_08770 [Chitinophagaceae bacterium]